MAGGGRKGATPKAGRPWTPEEDELGRALSVAEAARRTVGDAQHGVGSEPVVAP